MKDDEKKAVEKVENMEHRVKDKAASSADRDRKARMPGRHNHPGLKNKGCLSALTAPTVRDRRKRLRNSSTDNRGQVESEQ